MCYSPPPTRSQPVMKKRVLLCLVLLLVLAASIPALLRLGSHLSDGHPGASMASRQVNPPALGAEAAASGSLRSRLGSPAGLLLLQLVVIILVARGAGMLFRALGQPAIIGEMVAGILLGPSLL